MQTARDSMALNKIRSGIIVIAGSGMCEGGRMRHTLVHNLWRPECSVIFVPVSGKGTLGRRIVDGGGNRHISSVKKLLYGRLFIR